MQPWAFDAGTRRAVFFGGRPIRAVCRGLHTRATGFSLRASPPSENPLAPTLQTAPS
jgi:hypothetical protein